MLDQEFKSAADSIHKLKTKPNNDELLEVYSFYKQAEIGDNNLGCPALLDLKEKAKWSAWNEKKGLSQEEAKKKYIEKVNELIEKYGKN